MTIKTYVTNLKDIISLNERYELNSHTGVVKKEKYYIFHLHEDKKTVMVNDHLQPETEITLSRGYDIIYFFDLNGNMIKRIDNDQSELSYNITSSLPPNLYRKRENNRDMICDMEDNIVFETPCDYRLHLSEGNFCYATNYQKKHIIIYDNNYNIVSELNDGEEICDSIYFNKLNKLRIKYRYYENSNNIFIDSDFSKKYKGHNTNEIIIVEETTEFKYDFLNNGLILLEKSTFENQYNLKNTEKVKFNLSGQTKEGSIVECNDGYTDLYGCLNKNGKILIECKYNFHEFINKLIEKNIISKKDYDESLCKTFKCHAGINEIVYIK